ncbi:transcriptional regulator with XRE-family HTH domain [Neobacillus niacini]|uniref:helix-turn-helix domain-containing protein n=1 Tax=Neobacillus driksii TaxID=3035913 RepID=UPI00277DDFA2|nr:helix-turn-helix transcriptional regulator [Neobacillus niacini]MDQ0976731.1 transcriptional regulator with XRE-family HTH domain [Neobacillus niacini]
MECTIQVKHEQYLSIDGMRVKIARVEKDWTITKLAEMSGVTRKTIGEIERGSKKRIRPSTIQQIAITLDKQVEYFCTRIEKRIEGVGLDEL